MNRIKKYFQKNSLLTSVILAFFVYTLITLIIFHHRLPLITTHYGMPDVDADGGLWYQWYLIFTESRGDLYYITQLFSYPFGFDITFMPFRNLVYVSQVFILNIIGFSYSNLILLTNIYTLITYPLSAIGGYLLCYYFTKNKTASFFAGLIFSFSFYHVHMARSQLSVNHIELIPFYFLSLFYFIDKKTIYTALLSAFVYGILFYTDAYYAFFSGILSVAAFLIYSKENLISKLKLFLGYYTVLFTVLIAVNMNFFITNFYLFNTEQAVATGRNSIPKNELLSILYYFIPTEFSLLNTYIPLLGYILFLVIPFIAITGLLFLKKNRIYTTMLVCFLIGVILSAYIPYSYWINELYFKYFGIFRGVARMVLLSYLFVGIMVGLTIAAYMKTNHFKALSKKRFIIYCCVLGGIILLNVLNVDRAWWRLSDFTKEVKLYEPIKNNQNIHAIATYPMVQGKTISGCPETYQLKAQIIHNKYFACGASPFDPYAQQHYKAISDISNKGTIEYLTKYNIDTIMIYNDLLKNANKVNENLQNDSRISFVGRYTMPHDEGYLSTTDAARDVSVYQINKIVEENKKPKGLFYSTDARVKISYKKIAPWKYQLDISNLQGKNDVIFDGPFSKKWNLYIGDFSESNDFTFNYKAKSIYENHERYNQYANVWKLDAKELQERYSDSIHINTDKTTTIKATVFFTPQAIYYAGGIISNATILLLVLYFVIKLPYERHKR